MRDSVQERQRAFAAPHASPGRDEEFRLLVEAVKDYAIFMLDPEGRVVTWNAGAEAIKGYAAADIVGESFERFYTPEDRRAGKPRRGLETACAEGRFRDQGERLRKDGSRFWADVVITALWDEIGTLRGYAKVTRDITEQRRAQEALTESEARFRGLADNISQLAWMADGSGYVFWYNRRWFEYTGTSLDDMMGWGWRRVHHPEHVDRVVRRIQHAWDTGEPWEDTFPLRSHDGSYRWFLSRAAPIRDAAGKVVLWFGTNTDVTEQRETLRALEESERRLRFTLESSEIGDWDLDLDSSRVQASPQHWRILGYRGPVEGWSGDRFLEQVHPEDRGRVQAAVEQAVQRRADLHYECRIMLADGTSRWIEVHAAMRDAGHMSGILQDITARKRHEEEVRRLAATLEERVRERTAQLADANLEMQAFNYTVSHDLRAPLRGIRGFAEILIEDFSDRLGDEGRDYCRRISAAGERMEHLIEDLLAYGRLGRQELSLRPVELHDVVQRALESVADELRASRGSVHIEQPLAAVLGQRPILEQAVQNLLANALKFVASGAAPSIVVRAERRGACARLYVDDNGIGVAPEHRERIFGVFERLHGDEQYPGTGIGLAIVRRAVERLGGRAGVEPRAAGGSSFWIELPTP
jgi:PAS domain S-box-containing protein